MACPICDCQNFWTVPLARNLEAEQIRAAGDSREFAWRLCQRCGNAYPSHPPAQQVLKQLWASNRTDAKSSASERAAIWAYRRKIAKAGAARSYSLFAPLSHKSKGNFLDIACGLGETVHTFADHGWDAEGIDADPSTAALHREIGIRARISQIEELNINTSYDVVHIAHAIYFITDPMRFMRMVRERLAADGLFCIVLADFLANSDKAIPNYIHSFFPTRHSMRYALALAGFETVLCRRRSGSIFIAARLSDNIAVPFVWPAAILFLYRTKTLRYRLLGRPYLALRSAAKRFW